MLFTVGLSTDSLFVASLVLMKPLEPMPFGDESWNSRSRFDTLGLGRQIVSNRKVFCAVGLGVLALIWTLSVYLAPSAVPFGPSTFQVLRERTPSGATGLLKFLVIGDWGVADQHEDVAKAMGQYASLNDPSFVLDVGDHFYDNGIQSVNSPRFQSQFERRFSDKLMWMMAVGNREFSVLCLFRSCLMTMI